MSPNQPSTCLSKELLVGVKWKWQWKWKRQRCLHA
jgi:hypothetical protein